MFNIEVIPAVAGPTTHIYCKNGKPLVLATGEAAAKRAKWLKGRAHGLFKYRVVKQPPVVAGTWKKRERARFLDGSYKPVPWSEKNWFTTSPYADLHFPHASEERDGYLAFTDTEEKGEQDRHLRMKPGKYLERYFKNVLTPVAIRKWAEVFASLYEYHELHFATTEDEIVHVYTHGPHSCMHYAEDNHGMCAKVGGKPYHQVRVYAAGDLAVGYLKCGGRITARALCWPEKKIVSRMYGDIVRLKAAFEKAGFKYVEKSYNLGGARIKKVKWDPCGCANKATCKHYIVPYILPYIDWNTVDFVNGGDDHFFLVEWKA